MLKKARILTTIGTATAALFAAISLVTSSGAPAADWTITQSAEITTAAPGLRQGNNAEVVMSTQALNRIALESRVDDVARGSSQSANLTSSTGVTLTQGPLVSGSVQALNSMAGDNIGMAGTGSLSQTVRSNGTTTTTLNQNLGDGGAHNNNVQGLNHADATANLDALDQTAAEADDLVLSQTAANNTGNTQAVNYAKGTNIGVGTEESRILNQEFSVAGDTTLTQTTTTGTANTQAMNMAEGSGSAGDIDHADQDATLNGGNVNLNSQNAGGDNIQAINIVRSDGNIDGVTQDVSASQSTVVDFEQTRAGNSNIQAGNMAEIGGAVGGTSADIKSLRQNFAASTMSNIFDQFTGNGGNNIQAANLIDLGTGGMTGTVGSQTYTATAGSLVMSQATASDASTATGSSNNLQALNAIVDVTGGINDVNISQNAAITVTTFTMTQNGVANSGQFVNFAGLKL